MPLLLQLLLAATVAGAPAPERIAVLAVHDPPAPDGELTELTHQLRAASLERLGGVLTAPEMRDRLAGKSGGATVQELDRAFGGALAVYQNGELESAARTLRAIIDDLEDLPEGEAVWSQWTRAMMRLSHVHLSLKQPDEVDAVQVALLKVDSSFQLDPVLYAPGFRAHFEELRQRVRAMPKRRLTITARGRAGTIYVSGRDVGPTPATVILPVGGYRVAGAAGALRIPSFKVDLTSEDRAVVLDFALAETFRPGAGPGMVLPAAERAPAIIRAGAWLGVEKLVVASRGSEGGAQFLVGAIYDVRRGALLREGSVRLVSGSVPAANLGALASFLLTGQSSREVQDRTRDPQLARAAPARAVAATAPPPAPASAPPPQVTFIPATTGARPPASAPLAPAAFAATATRPQTPAPTSIPTSASDTSSIAAHPEPLDSARDKLRAEGAKSRGTSTPTATSTSSPTPTPTPTPTSTSTSTSRRAAVAVAASPPVAPVAPTPAPQPDLRPTPPPDDPVARALGAPTPAADPAPPTRRWAKPAALGAGILSAVLTGLAVQQGLTARSAYQEADAMMASGGVLRPPYTGADHQAALDDGDAARKNAWVAGTSALVSAAAAGVFYWLGQEPAGAPAP